MLQTSISLVSLFEKKDDFFDGRGGLNSKLLAKSDKIKGVNLGHQNVVTWMGPMTKRVFRF